MVNSNAIDVVAGPETLTWRLAGGQVDLFVLAGPTPALVAEQLASLVGLPALQPPWAFGVMNSKYGYASAAQCRQVVDSFDSAEVPLEVRVGIFCFPIFSSFFLAASSVGRRQKLQEKNSPFFPPSFLSLSLSLSLPLSLSQNTGLGLRQPVHERRPHLHVGRRLFEVRDARLHQAPRVYRRQEVGSYLGPRRPSSKRVCSLRRGGGGWRHLLEGRGWKALLGAGAFFF